MIEHLERMLRQTGKPFDQERANLVAVMRRGRGEDLPFPASVPILTDVPIKDKLLATWQKTRLLR